MRVMITKSKLGEFPGRHINNCSFNRDVYPSNSRRNMRIIDLVRRRKRLRAFKWHRPASF